MLGNPSWKMARDADTGSCLHCSDRQAETFRGPTFFVKFYEVHILAHRNDHENPSMYLKLTAKISMLDLLLTCCHIAFSCVRLLSFSVELLGLHCDLFF
jgi:hypothetical protein